MNYRLAMIPIVLLFASGAEADIYKCVAEDGSVSYSQIPCPKQASTTVQATVARTDDIVDCRWATQFANDVARRMRSGLPSDAVFNFYGGVDSVSAGTVNIINYVFRFRGNDAMPLERITSLAGSMCKAGSLGDVRCQSLPYGQDPSGKRCDPDAAEANTVQAAPIAEASNQAQFASGDTNRQGELQQRNDEAREQCKKSYRDQIDVIDAQMRRGYDSAQGEVYRERLRVLTTNLRAC